ncbi:3'(2'),5'-bisphosphate nucleotidase CysQ [Shinella kummerowiae]|uniref:3'(2'),5'-bisphosphate nucleotidase CysQ n=1 Tax=Shinella kummerowiae TaxID=417745 RepID=A0A6N8SNJ8_9HYPH|nr:3'(2'),5'-bisphosphate nucleotidase CysQ [Shinella kummerowiae]
MTFLESFEQIAFAAGRVIMEVYHSEIAITTKADKTPVTEADERAEALILKELRTRFPDIPVVGEEEVSAGHVPRLSENTFILVDPLDGTKEFINRRSDFTVNIALIEKGVPVAGIVFAPARGVAYVGAGTKAEKLVVSQEGVLIDRQPIKCRSRGDRLTAVASRSHSTPETIAFLKKQGIEDHKSVGSSLKFCLVAEGEADVYPRFGRTMEWDTAAGDAVLRAAGGVTLKTDGSLFCYGKVDQPDDVAFANPHFICWGHFSKPL